MALNAKTMGQNENKLFLLLLRIGMALIDVASECTVRRTPCTIGKAASDYGQIPYFTNIYIILIFFKMI